MLRQTSGFMIAVLCAGFMSGQTSIQQSSDRLFHFTHTEGATNFQQVGTLMRTMTDMKQASVDEAQKTLTLNGTAEQLALAEWLFDELDKPNIPAPNNRTSASLEY